MTGTTWSQLNQMPEDKLRTEIVIPLLIRTPDTKGVTDVHGRNEQGLDVVFFTEDAIRRTTYGLQLKRGNIGGGAKSKGTVEEVVTQLSLARKAKHPIAINGGERVKIERYIVATSGNITENARREIADAHSDLTIDFWDGHSLTKRIHKYFPELLTGVDAATVEYLKWLVETCDRLEALDQIQVVSRRTLSDIYEEPVLKRKYASNVAGTTATASAGTSQRGVQRPAKLVAAAERAIEPQELLRGKSRSVVIADQNDGKTSLIRMLSIRRARQLLSGTVSGDNEEAIPVIVSAREIVQSASLLKAVESRLCLSTGGQALADKAEQILSEGRLVIFIDSFSELGKESEKETCESLVKAAARLYTSAPIIVCGRPADFLTPKYFEEFAHVVVAAFSDEQATSLARKYSKGIANSEEVASRMVGRVREALQLPGSPIPAIIGVMVFEEERRYITNTADAVDAYMTIRLGRYAREMGIAQEVEWSRKQDLLAEVAFDMVRLDCESITAEQLTEQFDVIFRRLGERERGATAVRELIESGVLVEFDSQLRFHRVAFRDFFAGQHLFRKLSGQFDSFFSQHFFEKRWGQVLVFAAGLRRHNTELLNGLNGLVRDELDRNIDGSSERFQYGAYLLGRILANSEASDNSPRIAVLRTCLRAANLSLTEFAQLLKADLGNIGEIAALIGVEQTFLVTVGVPWLALQFRSLATDGSLSEEERLLCLSAHASLRGENWQTTVGEVLPTLRKINVVLAAFGLLGRLKRDRTTTRADVKLVEGYQKTLYVALRGRESEVKSALKYRSKILELEARRVRRLGTGA